MKYIFCEGGDDEAVIKGLASSIGLNDFLIRNIGGKNNLHLAIRAMRSIHPVTTGQPISIGVIRDADEDGKAAFQSVRDTLISNGFEAPYKNCDVTAGEVKTGLLIIGKPDGTGMIEDLCLSSVSDRPEFPCVDEYFRCVTEKSGRKDFTSKAKVRAWIASHPDPTLYVGKAAEKGHWPWEHPVFDPLKEFLRRL